MMRITLGIVNYGLLLVFGVAVSIYFADVKKTSANRTATVLFIILILIIQISCWQLFGLAKTMKLYPFISHFPLTLFITLYFKRSILMSCICVVSAYLCCQIPSWIGTLAAFIFNSTIAYYVFDIISILPILYLLKKHIAPVVYPLMTYSKHSLLMFGAMPIMYYLFDYATSVYTDLLYNGVDVAVEFMPSIVSMFYFIFVMIYYNEMQKRSQSENECMLLSMQATQAQKELSALHEIEEKTAYYRHDLRHHLSLIKGFLDDNDIKKLHEYLNQVQGDIDAITPKNFCHNKTVNLILSSFSLKANEHSIILFIDADLPESISLKDTELCTVISNGLENAVAATSLIVDETLRKIRISCKIHKSNLLIFIENPYYGKILMDSGLPKSEREGHGFGIRSIDAIVKKNNGYLSCEAKNGIFTMRIVIPIE